LRAAAQITKRSEAAVTTAGTIFDWALMRTESRFLACTAALLVLAACGARAGLDTPPPDATDDVASPDAAQRVGGGDAATRDVSPDPAAEASADAPDAPADVSLDASVIDSGPFDAGSVVAPRPLAPLSTARVTTLRPTFSWSLPATDDGAVVEVCGDRACTKPVVTFTAKGTSGKAPAALTPGVYFWRLRGWVNGHAGIATSATWELTVPVRDTPVDSSWGTTLDIDGDGYADVAVGAFGTSSSGTAYVFPGGPAGTLPPVPVTLTEPWGCMYPFLASGGDIDGDGYPELLVGCQQAGSGVGALLVYRGGPAWAASAPTVLANPAGVSYFGYAPTSAGDVNGDGYGDVLVAAQGAQDVGCAELYLGGPNGLSGPASTLNAGAFPVMSAATDLDGDGLSDVVLTVNAAADAGSTNELAIYLGTSTGLAATPTVLPMPTAPVGGLQLVLGVAGDVNGDGYGDVLASLPDRAAGIFVYFGGPGGLSASALELPEPGPFFNTTFGGNLAGLGDLNADGFDDVSTSIDGYATYVWLGGASPATTPAYTIPPPSHTSGAFGDAVASVGDVNGDGYADLGVSVFDGNEVLVFAGQPTTGPLKAYVFAAPSAGINGFGGSVAGPVHAQ
jgi:hypothetical protein